LDKFELDNVLKLVEYIFKNENEFDPVTQRTPYHHMGATITDAILQSGLNYQHVVYPRVATLLSKFSEYKTTCDFIILFKTIPLRELLNWKNQIKLDRITRLSWFLFENGVENENQLSIWLNSNEHIDNLSEINGIGPKTIDYLKMLSGKQSIPIDRHLFKFLELAGVIVKTYKEANSIYCKAAEKLNINQYELDKKIWLYMSKAGFTQ